MPTTNRVFTSIRQLVLLSLTGATLVTGLHAAPLLLNESDSSPLDPKISGSNAWLEIDTAAFDYNVKQVLKHLDGRADFCAIMKGDAYGNGIDGLMPTIIANSVKFIGIASNEEARIARKHGFEGRIIRVRSSFKSEIEAGIPYDVEEMIGSLAQGTQIAELSQQYDKPIGVHLTLNSTQMGRNGLEIGIPQGKADAMALVNMPGLNIVGMMTHFPKSDQAWVETATAIFDEQTQWLIENSPLQREDLVLHAASSFATLNVPEALFDMVRPGGLLYGRRKGTMPLATFKTRVASLHKLPKGSKVLYGWTATLTRDSVLANLPVGTSDGIARSLSNRGYVLINGERARIVGVTTMNTTMVDVTDMENIALNDEVVLYGKQGDDEITSAENKAHSDRSLGEQFVMWGTANPRVYR